MNNNIIFWFIAYSSMMAFSYEAIEGTLDFTMFIIAVISASYAINYRGKVYVD